MQMFEVNTERWKGTVIQWAWLCIRRLEELSSALSQASGDTWLSHGLWRIPFSHLGKDDNDLLLMQHYRMWSIFIGNAWSGFSHKNSYVCFERPFWSNGMFLLEIVQHSTFTPRVINLNDAGPSEASWHRVGWMPISAHPHSQGRHPT